jgi:DNA modification methylase
MKPYYEASGITIYHAKVEECISLITADLLLTDPPYGIGAASANFRSRGGRTGFDGKRREKYIHATDFGHETWDEEPPPAWIFGAMLDQTTYQIIFGGNYFPLPPSRCWLVWDKDNGTNDFADCEMAWTNFDKAVRLLHWRWNGMLQEDMSKKETRYHPTQKPLPVMNWVLSHAPKTITSVVDPYMGSGTSLLAAKLAGLMAVGIEQDERYCELAAIRLSQEVFNFEPPPPRIAPAPVYTLPLLREA